LTFSGDEQSRHSQQNQQTAQPSGTAEKYDTTAAPRYSESAESERPTENARRPVDMYYEDKSRSSVQPDYSRNQFADSQQSYSETKTEPSYDNSMYGRQGETHYSNPESQEYVPNGKDYQATEPQHQQSAIEQSRGIYETQGNEPNQGYLDSRYSYETDQAGGGYQPDQQYQHPYSEQGYQQSEQGMQDPNLGYSVGGNRGYEPEDMGQKYESSEQPRSRYDDEQSRAYYGQERSAPMQESERRMSLAPEQQQQQLQQQRAPQQPAYSAGGSRASDTSKQSYKRAES